MKEELNNYFCVVYFRFICLDFLDLFLVFFLEKGNSFILVDGSFFLFGFDYYF